MNQVLRIALFSLLCMLTAVAAFPNQEPFAFSEVSSGELLAYAEQRAGIRAERENLSSATAALEKRLQAGQSDYLSANLPRVNMVIAAQKLFSQRWEMETALYSYQRDPEQLIKDINASHFSPAELSQLPEADYLIETSLHNLHTALQLLAIFGAYELSIGQFDQALETLELYTDLPEGVHPAALTQYRDLLSTLRPALTRYTQASRRLPIPEAFVASLSFGLAAATLADLTIPGFSLPFYPGDSSQRTAALAGTALGSSLIGVSAIVLPPMLRRPPVYALSEYLSETWGHLIEGSIQIFEDFRHQPRQLILLTLEPNRFVVFPESASPRSIPGVFTVDRTGQMRIQMSSGSQRITIPARAVHDDINLVPLVE